MKIFIRLLSWIIILISFLYAAKILFIGIYGQDLMYYYNAVHALTGNANPYTTGYIYPPICLIILYPLQFLSLPTARLLWTVLSLLALCVSLVLLLKLYNYRLFSTSALLIWSLAFIFFPVRWTLGMGQINMYILLLLSMAIVLFSKGKYTLAGICFGLTLAIKYFPVFILPYLIMRKQWKILWSLILTLVVLTALGFILLPRSVNTQFFTQILPGFLLAGSGNDAYYNQALSGFLAREVQDETLRWIWRISTSLSVFFITFLLIYKRPANKQRIIFEFGIIITLSLLLNSFSWQHHYTWLLIPLIAVFTTITKAKKSIMEYSVLALVYLLSSININTPGEIPAILLSHTFYGGTLLWMFMLYRAFRFARGGTAESIRRSVVSESGTG